MFTLRFDTDNAAFEDDVAAEYAATLRRVVAKLKEGRTDGPLFDLNGNKIGEWGLTP